MIINNLIKILNRDNSVYINDLGLIEKKFIPSSIDKGTIYPPHYTLTLNPEEDGNGFDFVLFVSQEEGLPLLNADDKIREWTSELNDKIGQGENVHYENFGTFLKKNDKTEFICDDITELNSDYEGMAPIQIPDAAGDKTKHKDKSKRHNHLTIIIFIIVLILSAGFAAYIFRAQLKDAIEEIMTNFGPEVTLPNAQGTGTACELAANTYIPMVVLPEPEEEVIVIPYSHDVDTLQKNEENPAEDSDYSTETSEEPELEKTKQEQPKSNSKVTVTGNYPRLDYTKGKYYLIAGSFGNVKDANKHAVQKERIGYLPQLLYQEGTHRIRVCVAVFDELPEAEAFKEAHPDCWILE